MADDNTPERKPESPSGTEISQHAPAQLANGAPPTAVASEKAAVPVAVPVDKPSGAARALRQLEAAVSLLERSENALFRASTTLENDLKEVARGVKAQLTTCFLRDIIRVLNGIWKEKLKTMDDVREELGELLQLNGLSQIPVAEGDAFNARLHKAIDKKSTADESQHQKVFKVHGIGWLRTEDNNLFVPAEVIVFEFHPAP